MIVTNEALTWPPHFLEHRNTSRVSGLCWPRQRSQDKSSMQELKQVLACDASKISVPQYRVQNTNRNQGKGRDDVEEMGGGQGAPLPNTLHCEITDWTVKTLAEQSQKYSGAVGSKIRPINELLPLCQLWTQIYTTASSRKSKVNYIILKRISKTKFGNAKVGGRGETVMCCPTSETAAAVPSS